MRDLGFTISTYFNNTTFPVPVDHRGRSDVNANCEGNASGNGVGRFRFGPCDTGTTVGMGAEGRTVYHEFGHALLWDSVNSPNFGFAHSAGDSLAMIVTDPHTALTGSSRFIVFTFCPLSPSSPDRRADRLPAAGWAWGGRAGHERLSERGDPHDDAVPRVPLARRRLAASGHAGVRVALRDAT